MSGDLILDFPVLKKDGGDFIENISYEVEVDSVDGELKIEHKLKGLSFVGEAVKIGDAKFSVWLLYKNSSERQSHVCNSNVTIQGDSIISTQTVSMDFSYAPEVSSSIVLMKDKTISVDNTSGLTDFWEQGESFDIPKYSRIAIGQKLKFTSGDLSNLMKVVLDNDMGPGEMKVVVYEQADEGIVPVTLCSGQGVYDQLMRVKKAKPKDASDAARSAIVTQALCAIYAYMHKEWVRTKCETSGVLAAHLVELRDKTKEDWEADEFDPSLAATKMRPYVTKFLNGGNDND